MADESFVGHVVQVFVDEPAEGCLLENVNVRQLAGRDFLVGTMALQNYPDLRVGQETWCALDHVQMLIHFPSVDSAHRYWEDVKRKLHDHEPQTKKRHWWQRS